MAVIKPKIYSEFRGVDYSASPAVISEEHASDLLNMYINDGGELEKRPGWHVMRTFTDGDDPVPINGIHFLGISKDNGCLFIHAGTKLYYTLFVPQLRHIRDRENDPGDVPYFKYPGDHPTASEASMILGYVAGIYTDYAAWQVKNMDINGDGKVTNDDADALLAMIVGLGTYGSNGVLSESYIVVKDALDADLPLSSQKSVSFAHDNYLYLLDGEHYYRIKPKKSGSGTVIGFVGETVEGYIPTTGVNGHYEYDELNEEGTNPPGSEENPGRWVAATKDEDRNLLSTKQIITFATDGIHKAYYLRENNNVVHKVEIYKRTRCHSEEGKDIPDPTGNDPTVYYYWKYMWTEVQPDDATYGYTVTDASENTPIQNGIAYATKIQFTNTIAAVEENAVNVRVTFSPRKHSSEWAVAKDRGYIEKATIVTRFGYFNDNRFFVSGNPEHRSMDLMSAVDDPTYFPNTGWTKIGSDMTAIQGYLHYGSELAIIKEDNGQDATVYMRSAILTEDNNVIFPVQQGAQGVGAISKWCLKTLKDEPLFLAKEGVYAIQGTDATQERNIPNRSFFIDTKLKQDIVPSCVAEVFKDYYILCNPTNGHCWVADARYQALPPGTNDRSRVYEWFRWDNVPASVIFATDDYLFFGTTDGRLCLFNFDWDHPKRWTDGAVYQDGAAYWNTYMPYDGGEAIHAYYVTKRDHLNALDYKKTMLNDGGVIVLKPLANSSASITVTTDRGTWFVDQIQTDSDEPSVVIPIRHRFKNFDSIETRIENNEYKEGLSLIGLQYRYVDTTNRR